MRAGDFDAAWAISDELAAERRHLSCRDLPRECRWLWDGTPVDGRRVRIRCYRGLGDAIQFVRYVPLVRAVAAETLLIAPPALVPVLSTVRGVGPVVAEPACDVHGCEYLRNPESPRSHANPSAQSAFDLDVEMMELPHVFRTTLATIPRPTGYVRVAPTPLPRTADLSIGIVWRSGDWDDRRSVPFALIAALIERHSSARWYAFQRGPALAEWSSHLGDVSPGAALIEEAAAMRSLDLMITVDSMQAHLSGALGVCTWTLLHADADWRWLERRDDTPWYPTMRLFRQQYAGEWRSVLDRVSACLDAGVPRVRVES